MRAAAGRDVLYSVFDVADSVRLFHLRARLSGASAAFTIPGFRFFPLADLPYEEIPAGEIRALLRRYSRERRDDSFSIYMDSGDGGRLARIEGASQPWSHGPRDAEQEKP